MEKNANNQQVHLLLAGLTPFERFSWLSRIFNREDIGSIRLHVTGDSLLQLISCRDLSFSPGIIHWDEYEAKLLGIDSILNKIYPTKNSVRDVNQYSFWAQLFTEIKALEPTVKSFDLFHNNSPYMHRDAVYALRYLETAFRTNLLGNLYCYLDGVHLGNSDQNPSEFQNIGKGLQNLTQEHHEFTMLACARCAKARGYVSREENGELFFSNKVLPRFSFVNLRHIVQRFLENNIILSLNGGVIFLVHSQEKLNAIPSILIFITHSPYDTEWSFGGLSFSLAAHNQGIPVQVIFIEDGVYNLTGHHQIPIGENIFNIQEIIDSVEGEIPFFYYSPACSKRILEDTHMKREINNIDSDQLLNLILNGSENSQKCHRRLFFF